ncbi:MAG: hypothetical protein R8M45_05840 [Ghiorsea sp.]
MADIGLHWAVVMTFNGADEDYLYARDMIDLYQGQWNSAYFENEYAEYS